MTAPEVIVVGAGIVGAACAEALAADGVRVRVLEAGRAGGGASAAGMGHVLVLDDSDAQFALTRYSRDLWDARVAEWPDAVEREGCGTLWVAADDEEMDAVIAKYAWYAARGVAVEVVEGPRLYELEPNLRPGLRGGLRVPDDSVVYPPAATRALLDRAADRGAEVEENAPVRRAGPGLVELVDGRRMEAERVVVTAGLATPGLVDVPGLVVRPKKGHLAITDRAPGFLRHQLVELGYLKSAHGGGRESVAFNAQPRRTGQVLLGSSRQLDDADPSIDRSLLARMVRRGLEYLPGLARLPVIRAWVGLRPSTDDNLPVIGPTSDAGPEAGRLWIAAGHEGVGITTSLGTARLVADGIAGRRAAIDPAPFAVARLARGGGAA